MGLPDSLARSQGFLAPRVPVDGVVGVLLEVGAGFLGEAVGHRVMLAQEGLGAMRMNTDETRMNTDTSRMPR